MSTPRTGSGYSLSEALGFIPQLDKDGHPRDTALFCRVVRKILDKFSSVKRHIFSTVKSKIPESVAKILPGLETYDFDVEWLLRDLPTLLGYPEQVFFELRNVSQNPAERAIDII